MHSLNSYFICVVLKLYISAIYFMNVIVHYMLHCKSCFADYFEAVEIGIYKLMESTVRV